MSYIDKIKERAKLDKKTIVLPESKDKRTLLAAAKIMEEGIANIIMVGDEEKIMDGAGWLEVDLTNITVINPANTPKLEEYVNLLYETRKTKGMTPEKAREILLDDYLTFGIVMVKAGDADGMVAGACHSTADTLRPALQILKTAPGVKLVSAFFVMDTQFKDQGDEGAFLFADCGLNQDPTAEELAAIAETSYRSFKSLIGPKPVIAMLSHSTKGSAKHAMVDKVVEATRIAREEYPHLILDGELETALKYAAERGVDVKIILPGIPDKKAPYALAKTHYASLLKSGVGIYEYIPGFVHAKVFVSDDNKAVVGTINLDYRSLYHHFECATFLYETGCIPEIERDFTDTLARCRQVTAETIRNEKLRTRIFGSLLKVIAPLL